MRRIRPPLTPEQRDLAERYLPLARGMVREFLRPRPWLRDEADSAAALAIVNAAAYFDPAFGVHFATYARKSVHCALLDVLRDRHRARRDGPPIGRADVLERVRDSAYSRLVGSPACDRGPLRFPRIAPPPSPGCAVESADAFASLLGLLPPRRAEALRRTYVSGQTRAQAAAAMGVSPQAVHNYLILALQDFRGRWADRVRLAILGECP